MNIRQLATLAFLSVPSSLSFAVSLPAFEDASTTPQGEISTASGKAKSLAVSPSQQAFILFNLDELPPNYTADNITSARLRLYVGKFTKPGGLSVHLVTSAWTDTAAGPAPTFVPAPMATVDVDGIREKGFILVDVTAAVLTWLDNPGTNFGLAVAAAGPEPTTQLKLGSREGPALGFPSELEVEIGSGTANLLGGSFNVIGGGSDNTIEESASFSTIPGGAGNDIGPGVQFGFAAGRRAFVANTGSFVLADSTNFQFTSTANDQLSMRFANGFFFANDAGESKTVPVGTRYRDNAIVAWGRITATGILESGFNVLSVTHVSTGRYSVVLRSSLLSGFFLMPAVTPEVDPDGGNNPPTGLANLRYAVTNQLGTGSNFEIYVYNGNGALVDNDIHFLVTGR